MSGMFKKGMSWLGLGPDEDYAEFEFVDDQYPEPQAPARPRVAAAPANSARAVAPAVSAGGEDWEEPETGGIRVLPASSPGMEPARHRGVVRPLPTLSSRPQVISPKSFNDAQEIGDLFKRSRPVVLNLQHVDRELGRRLLDFSSGVTYGLGGTVERAAASIILLIPADVEISPEDRQRIVDGDLGVD